MGENTLRNSRLEEVVSKHMSNGAVLNISDVLRFYGVFNDQTKILQKEVEELKEENAKLKKELELCNKTTGKH